MTFDRWLEAIQRGEGANHRVIDQTQVGLARVSTVFLGLDHSYAGEDPLWFETMIFGPRRDVEIFGKIKSLRSDLGYQERYTTLEQAKEGHAKAIAWCKAQAWYQ